MGIVRDDGSERQLRVDRMIDEFRTAQSRRKANAVATPETSATPDGEQPAAAPPEGDAHAAVVPPRTPRTSQA